MNNNFVEKTIYFFYFLVLFSCSNSENRIIKENKKEPCSVSLEYDSVYVINSPFVVPDTFYFKSDSSIVSIYIYSCNGNAKMIFKDKKNIVIEEVVLKGNNDTLYQHIISEDFYSGEIIVDDSIYPIFKPTIESSISVDEVEF